VCSQVHACVDQGALVAIIPASVQAQEIPFGLVACELAMSVSGRSTGGGLRSLSFIVTASGPHPIHFGAISGCIGSVQAQT
jgi:hypothetical protein